MGLQRSQLTQTAQTQKQNEASRHISLRPSPHQPCMLAARKTPVNGKKRNETAKKGNGSSESGRNTCEHDTCRAHRHKDACDMELAHALRSAEAGGHKVPVTCTPSNTQQQHDTSPISQEPASLHASRRALFVFHSTPKRCLHPERNAALARHCAQAGPRALRLRPCAISSRRSTLPAPPPSSPPP